MRRLTWLIWLFVALLPLRGMAHAVMVGAGADHGVVAAASDADVVPPCPMHVAADDAPAASPLDDAQPTPCQLCAACHGAALPSTDAARLPSAAPAAEPQAQAGLGAGRLRDGELFRPPRSSFA